MEGVDLVALVHEFKTLGAWVLLGLAVFIVVSIMAWKDSWPCPAFRKRYRRRRGSEDDSSVIP